MVDINAVRAPGVYAFTSADGTIPAAIANHSNVYLLGTATQGPIDTPTQVVSTTDFTNIFGDDSLSELYISLYFANDPNGVLFFVRCTAADDAVTDASEFITAIGAALDDSTLPQGYLIAPQAFALLGDASDKLSVALAMRDHCERERFQWLALVDASLSSQDTTALQTEFNSVTSSQGHVAVYAPWVIDLNDNQLPPSAAVAGVATRRAREQGFYQPPAGPRYVLRGVKGVVWKAGDQHQEILNPLGINIIRDLGSRGICIWGARVRSTEPAFTFVNQRVIFNVLARTLVTSMHSLLFQAVDARGLVFGRIKGTAVNILDRFYEAGALYGETPSDAYLVVCGPENNPALDLEQGTLRVDIYAVPAPTLERIINGVRRVPIGHFTFTL